jgi:hypothetical protein
MDKAVLEMAWIGCIAVTGGFGLRNYERRSKDYEWN